ncbi:hypothetical protein ACNI3K_00415 [Demequina sp. SO4-13]|uniref:hypothetical protein n=1 Tax=Demequina sp. SO4-13 TaxID=3401027 RepID=UPI003AF88B12
MGTENAWQLRQATLPARRRLVMATMESVFDLGRADSPVSVLRQMIDSGKPHSIVANADMDGLLASQMLSAVTGWKIGALLSKGGRLLIHPSHGRLDSLLTSGSTYCVDLFNRKCPGVSNHPLLWRPKPGKGSYKDSLRLFDMSVETSVEQLGSLNLSAAAGIGAMQGYESAHGIQYKYPLGTAQLLLAALEIGGHAPRFYDRQILPWLVANADGGLGTIRLYAWNAELWWNGLAAAAGPASMSEAIFRVATEQRPNQREEVDRRLRWEYGDVASVWKADWNLAADDTTSIATHVELASTLSGWPDPFQDGVQSLAGWTASTSVGTSLSVGGISKLSDKDVFAAVQDALNSSHFNFNTFDQKVRLSWQ